ncbi:MAG: hypothetical protein HQL48_02105 [Gammaproteobacteria bacterium]|nr:hypothetical protein [Gammaproteobacteria bacterium]
MFINTGHLEEQPELTVCLVRFEDENGELGLPVTVWPDELMIGSTIQP